MRVCNAASTFSNSFASVSSPSHSILLGCTSLETTYQLLDFDYDFFPAMKVKSDSKTKIVTASSSFNKLTMARSSFFFRVQISFMPFKAFCIAFFTAFLEAKYFSTSLASSILLPCLLRRVD